MLSSATLALNEIIGRKGELLFLPLFVPQIVIRLINVFRMLFQPFLACTLKTCDIFPLGAKPPICVHTCPCHKFTLSFRCMNFTRVFLFLSFEENSKWIFFQKNERTILYTINIECFLFCNNTNVDSSFQKIANAIFATYLQSSDFIIRIRSSSMNLCRNSVFSNKVVLFKRLGLLKERHNSRSSLYRNRDMK